MKIVKFEKDNLGLLRKLIEAKLAELKAETGVNLSLGNITFSAGEFNTRLTGKVDAAVNPNIEKEKWERFSMMFGLPKDGFGKKISMSGKQFEIVGINPNKPKNCVSIKEISTGKIFITTAMAVKYATEI